MTETDIKLMREAIGLAEGCNPIKDGIPKVGAVIAVGEVVIGSGRHGNGEAQRRRAPRTQRLSQGQ
jgi:pyrimidine deaminase RibD-like protein